MLASGVYACTGNRMASVVSPRFAGGSYEDSLRFIYSQDPARWPLPDVRTGVRWNELAALPHRDTDTGTAVVRLGKLLFFDPRLSESNKISCASCHQPELSWTDGRERSLGHEDQSNKRNSPTILNSWFYTSLFWDGRSRSLEDQAFSPINSETEMHSDMPTVIGKLRKIEGYVTLFREAFNDEGINPETLTEALAVFQRTLSSQPADFDRFLSGDRKALSDEALRGLHLFRTAAGCMNCHNGPLLSDNGFHNGGLPVSTARRADQGRYEFTKDSSDIGRYRTPSLRDVTRTGPWMHDGSIRTLHSLPARHLAAQLRPQQVSDLIAFLQSISADPPVFRRPALPQ